MKKQIIIEVVSSPILTNPPQADTLNIKIDGIEPVEAILLLTSITAQMAAKELPVIVTAIKEARSNTPPIPMNPKMGIA